MTVNSIESKFNRTYRKLTAIWSAGIIGLGMMVTGLLEAGTPSTSTTTGLSGNFTADPYDVPMKETATGPYLDQPDLVMEGANASSGIPIFGEWIPAFLFLGGFVVVMSIAYIDYTRVHPEE